MRSALLWLGLVLALAVPGALILDKERLLRHGAPIYLELAPVDPRSLIQGDYMRLDYRILRDLEATASSWPADGRLVLELDERGVVRGARRADPALTLEPGARLLAYRRRGGRLRLGAEAFFFEEGRAELFARARYSELRVGADGTSVLVALLDENLERLGPKV